MHSSPPAKQNKKYAKVLWHIGLKCTLRKCLQSESILGLGRTRTLEKAKVKIWIKNKSK